MLAAYLALGYPGAYEAALREMRETYDVEDFSWLEFHCGPVPNPLNPRGDADGDGFLNHQEWDYLRLYENNPVTLTDDYAAWVLDPEQHPTVPVDCIPKTTVRIDVTGQGWVYPGVGDHQFATYAQTCAFNCPVTAPLECENNTIALTADPAAGWIFDGWRGEVPDNILALSNPEDPAYDPARAAAMDRDDNPTIELTMQKSRWIKARFVYFPGYDALDLVEDLGHFLVSTGINEEASDVWNLNHDRGDYHYDVSDTVYTGDGIPDAAEFYLLQELLLNRTYDRSNSGGAAHGEIIDAFSANLLQTEADLGSVADAHAVRTVAAYMTMGSYALTRMITAAVRDTWSIELDAQEYDTRGHRHFHSEGDVDGDADTNLMEWIFARDDNPGDAEAQVAAYAARAMDQTLTGAEPEGSPEGSPEGEGTPEGEGMQEGEGAGEGEGEPNECRCTNDANIGTATFTLIADAGLEVSATLLSTGGTCQDRALTGAGDVVKKGSDIRVSAKTASGAKAKFYKWSAPGTFINGSDSATEVFTITQNTTTVTATAPYNTIDAPKTHSRYVTLGGPYVLVTYNVSSSGLGEDAQYIQCIPHPTYENMNRYLVPEGLQLGLYADILVEGVSAGASWHGFPNPPYTTQMDSLSAAVSVGSISSVDFEINAGPLGPTWNHLAQPDGQGLAMLGCGEHARFVGSVTGGQSWTFLAFNAKPRPGWLFDYWLDEDTCQIASSLSVVSWIVNRESNYTAVFRKLHTLTIERAGRYGADQVPPSCLGYVVTDPITDMKKFYGPASTLLDPPIVTLVANANTPYSFLTWRGEGEAWYENETPGTDPSHELLKEDPGTNGVDPFYNHATIKIRMDKARTLEAQFCACVHLGTSNSGSLKGDEYLNTGTFLDRFGTSRDTDLGGDAWGCAWYIHTKLNTLGWTWYNVNGAEIGAAGIVSFNDISNLHGGEWTGQQPLHRHENGLDVDLAYMATPGLNREFLDLLTDDYDIVRILYDARKISGNPQDFAHEGLTLTDDPVVHYNHWHVRYKDPDFCN